VDEPTKPILTGVAVILIALLALAAAVGDRVAPADAARGRLAATTGASGAATTATTATTAADDERSRSRLPHGVRRIFGNGRTLVAYYGTSGSGALGVLGETNPDTMVTRVRRAAAPFRHRHSPVQVVFELIVTIADRTPGPDGSYSHDIAARDVRRYIRAAHRHQALLLLDLQPGRSGFLATAKRWAWALRDPYVGLALDPEWRMGAGSVPGQRIGSVDAAEVNRTSAWLRDLIARNRLPQKLFVLHQFRTDMIRRIDAIEPRRGLVMVQHVDGFGTPGQKLDTFHTVARPGRFLMGFKLFYDEDVHRMTPGQVRAMRPMVRFVSYQ
jgi:hypothetical protein